MTRRPPRENPAQHPQPRTICGTKLRKFQETIADGCVLPGCLCCLFRSVDSRAYQIRSNGGIEVSHSFFQDACKFGKGGMALLGVHSCNKCLENTSSFGKRSEERRVGKERGY